ncbi:MAG: DUF1700 domain-containing protein [Oscillospiraceae bacterium]|jgi:uncharacterized membrane protein|nr:DUF1700 domain-containing protein [Oscillospiraceae bacterium]
MTKREFLDKLRRRLRALPRDEIDAAVSYYDEYISDAGDEAEAIAQLGSPLEVAGLIAAGAAAGIGAGGEGASSGEKRGGARTAAIAVLSVFALPVGLPLAISLAAAAFSTVLAALTVFVSLGAVSAALILGGVASALIGSLAMLRDFALGLAVSGEGLVMFGAGWLLLRALAWLWKRGAVSAARAIGTSILKKANKLKERS